MKYGKAAIVPQESRKTAQQRTLPLSVEEQMLNAAELLHYADKFRDEIFACVLGHTQWLSDIFLDLKVFYLAHIKILICCPYEEGLRERLLEWNPRGYAFDYHETAADAPAQAAIDAAYSSLRAERIPVIAFRGVAAAEFPPSAFHDHAIAAAAGTGAHKIFLLSALDGVSLDHKLLSHISEQEAREFTAASPLNIPEPTLAYLSARRAAHEVDLVVLRARSGNLFQEVFTHLGVGTLFSDDYHNVFRRAQLNDSRDIAFLMKPYVQARIMLPLSEDEIAATIDSFYVYTINAQIVAVAKLSSYGEAYELGKLATLPRYRGKGLARALVQQLVQRAAEDGKRYLFALTVDVHTGNFFKRLGFEEVPRESLPAEWQAGYDFKRGSLAYRCQL